MDRRDEMAEFGSPLSNLPDVEINEDSMTATFFVEADPPEPPPPPPPSRLEQMGAKLDKKLASFVDRVTEKLVEKGAFHKLSYDGKTRYPTNEYSEWFPKVRAPGGWPNYPTGFRELAKKVIAQRSLYHLFRVHVDMRRHWTPPGKDRRENALLLDFHVFDSTRYFPHLNVWFAFNCYGQDYHDYKIRPFQVGVGRTPCVR
jgi:hypothetical protein